jgi:hypothetical protein
VRADDKAYDNDCLNAFHTAGIANPHRIIPSPNCIVISTATILYATVTIIAMVGGVSLASSGQAHATHTSSVTTPRGIIASTFCPVFSTTAIRCTAITTTAKDIASRRLGFVYDMPKT